MIEKRLFFLIWVWPSVLDLSDTQKTKVSLILMLLLQHRLLTSKELCRHRHHLLPVAVPLAHQRGLHAVRREYLP